jgi:TM2 domain-containing membrane protein YozV
MAVIPTSLSGASGIVTVRIIILGATIAFVIYFIMGLIGGLIGVAIKERNAEKQIFRT